MILEIKAIIRPDRLSDLLHALHTIPRLPGVTVSAVRGFGRRFPVDVEQPFDEVEMTQLEIVVSSVVAEEVIATIKRTAHTGRVGDGRIYVTPVAETVEIRSGEREGAI